jgi:hypothetical protein
MTDAVGVYPVVRRAALGSSFLEAVGECEIEGPLRIGSDVRLLPVPRPTLQGPSLPPWLIEAAHPEMVFPVVAYRRVRREADGRPVTERPLVEVVPALLVVDGGPSPAWLPGFATGPVRSRA